MTNEDNCGKARLDVDLQPTAGYMVISVSIFLTFGLPKNSRLIWDDSDDLDEKVGLRNLPQDFSELVMVAELAEVAVPEVELLNQEDLCSGHGHETRLSLAGHSD